MKKFSRFFLTIVAVVMSICFINTKAFAEEVSERELQEFAKQQLECLLECNTGELLEERKFFDIEGEISAYLYQYENTYIVVGANEKFSPVIEFGEGEFVFNTILEENNIDYEQAKMLYTGALNYGCVTNEQCYALSDNRLKEVGNIENMECSNETTHSAEWSVYDSTKGSTYVSGEVTNPNNYEKYYYSLSVKDVPSYSYTYEIMSNYSGYNNHCAPTAAVNLMKYWYLRSNSKYNALLANSWYNTFRLLHSYMGTTNTIGTYTSMLDRAYAQYLSSRGFSNFYVKLYKNPSTYIMTNEINNGYPFHMCVYGSKYYGNHSVLALGYRAYTYFENSSYSTVYYFRIADGWHTSSRYVNANIGLNSIDAVAVHIN